MRCRLLHVRTGKPLPGLTVSLGIGVGEGTTGVLLPAGTLCTDGAGYVSFDLSPWLNRGLQAASRLTLTSPQAGLRDHDLLAPITAGVPQAHGGGLASHLGEAGTALPEALCLVFPVYVEPVADAEAGDCASACGTRSLPSIQAPDACDYRVSPFSFVSPASARLGDGCCEVLVPATLPLQEHRFYKVVALRSSRLDGGYEPALRDVRTPSSVAVDVTEAPRLRRPELRFGEILEFRQQWFSLGHSLGEIKYSLALAPGESTQIAVIDWSRQDAVSRTDSVKGTEYLDHDLRRDRAIEETVDAALREEQGGSSFMAGTSGAATIPLQYVTLTFNHALGGSISNSWGERNLEGDSLQSLHDRVRQASAYTRSLTSTVIVQGSQAEQNLVQTRRVANHNHSHALTVQYYEVLRHYRIQSRFSGRRKAVLVPFKPFVFDWMLALKFRTILEQVLLDPSLKPCFDAIFRLHFGAALYDAPQTPSGAPAPPAPPPPPGTRKATVSVEGVLGEGVGSGVQVKKGDLIRIAARGEVTFWPGIVGVGAWSRTPNGDSDLAEAQGNFLATGLRKYSLLVKVGTDGPWRQGGTIATLVADRDGEVIFGINDQKGAFEDNKGFGHDAWTVDVETPSHEAPVDPPPVDPGTSTGGSATPPKGPSRPEDEVMASRLLLHLAGNQGHYNRAVWILQDVSERRAHLETALAGRPDVLDAMDDTPLAVSGHHVAFPYHGDLEGWSDPREGDPTDVLEDVVALPTRGVFAEAMLGHCNASEKRDVTRLWDWTQMTAEEPPAMSGLTPGPKGQATSVTPVALPGNVIQITQPPTAPDPAALANALGVLKTPEIFRDMSGLDEVSKLLQKLSEETADMNVKALAAAAKTKVDEVKGKTAASGGAASGGAGTKRSPAAEPDAGKQVDRLQAIQVAKDQGLIDQAGARSAAQGVLGGDLLASSGDTLPGDVAPRKGLFPSQAPAETKIRKVLALFGDAPLASASDINQIFGSLGSAGTYPQWLEEQAGALGIAMTVPGYYRWQPQDAQGRSKKFNFRFNAQVDEDFVAVWDQIPVMYGPGRDSINLLEFLALDLASHVEGFGDYRIVSEVAPRGRGLDYFFDPDPASGKSSYNLLAANRPASACFADPVFQSAHQDLLATAPAGWNPGDAAWSGDSYALTGAPTSSGVPETAYIQQADFFKFRGRGLIQTTNRSNYLALARLLRRNLDAIPSPLWSLVEGWGPETMPDAALQDRLTATRDADWDNLFQMTGGVVAALGIQAFNQGHGQCMAMPATLEALGQVNQGPVRLGNAINGYGPVLSAAVSGVLVRMYDQLAG